MGGNSGRKVRPQVIGSEGSHPRRITATGQALAQPESRSRVERRLIDAQLTAIEKASREVLETLDYPTALDTLAAEGWSSSDHPSVMTVLLAYAYGKPCEAESSEPVISMSELEEARQSLQAKLQHIADSLESRPVVPPAGQR